MPGRDAIQADIESVSAPQFKATPEDPLGKFTPLPNILDKFDQSTYHFKLYMIDEESVFAQRYLTPRQKVIIAESGVTADISVVSVELTSYAGQHFENKNKLTTAFEIKLAETFGSSLIDKIYEASLDLNILNYTEAMFFLELSFRGRDSKESNITTPQKFGDTMTWPIKITAIETTMDTAGAMYTIKAFLYTNLGFSNEHVGVMPKTIRITPGTTVSEAFKALGDAFNNGLRNRAVGSYTIEDKVLFVVDPRLGALKMGGGEPTNPSKSTETEKPNEPKTINIPKNYNITAAINAILAASGEYVKGVRDTETADTVDSEEKQPELKKSHRISTFSQHIGFDPVRNRPRRRFIFIITQFKTANLISNMSETGQNKDSKTTFNNLRRANAISKHYNYIFTGLNDQIIDFELKFNFGWYVKRPPNGGKNITREQVTEGVQFTPEIKRFLSLRRKMRDTVAAQKLYFEKFSKLRPNENFTKEDIEEFKQKVISNAIIALETLVRTELDKANDSSTDTAVVLKFAMANIGGLAVQAADKSWTLDFGDGIKLSINPDQAAILGNAERIATEARRGGRLGIANDIFSRSLLSAASAKKPTSSAESFVTDYTAPIQRTSVIPVSYSLSDVEDMEAYQRGSPLIEQDSTSGIPYMDSLLGQAFSSIGGDMVSLTVTIKGDPFWLETPALFNGQELPAASVDDVETLAVDIMNIMTSLEAAEKGTPVDKRRISSIFKQNYIIFTVNTPMTAGVQTGVRSQGTEAQNGLYSVNAIKSIFENGKFIQEITCYKELSVDTKDIIKDTTTNG